MGEHHKRRNHHHHHPTNHKNFHTRYRQTPWHNTPVLLFIGELLASLVSIIYWLRWQLSRPFQVRLLPKWTPRLTLPGCQALTYMTYGETILLLPIAFLAFTGYYYCIMKPNVDTSGSMSSYAIIYAFLLANKSSSIFSFLLGIPFERLIFYHKLSAVLALSMGILHTVIAFQIVQQRHDTTTTNKNDGIMSIMGFFFSTINNSLGSIILFCLAGFVTTSIFPFFRRKCYDAWLCLHVLLAIATALPWAAHSINMVWLPLFWWTIDLLIRYVVMARCYYPRCATIRKLPHCKDVMEVKFKKPLHFHYRPGQFVRICIPSITAFQFHPFSLSSAPHEEYVTLHIRALGNWTQQLLQLLKDDDDGEREIELLMEGPYGALSMDLDHPRYGMVLCVAGGIGVTHCRSVARSVVDDHVHHGRQLEQLRFVWAVKEHDLAVDLPPFDHQLHINKAQPILTDVEGGYQVSFSIPEPAIVSSSSAMSMDGVSTVDNDDDDFLSMDGLGESEEGEDREKGVNNNDDDDEAVPLIQASIQADVYVTVNDNNNDKVVAVVEENSVGNSDDGGDGGNGGGDDDDGKNNKKTSNKKTSNEKTSNEKTSNNNDHHHHHHEHVVLRDGRPNLDHIVEEMKVEAMKRGVTHVAAFGCGPKPLIDALQEACRKHSQSVQDYYDGQPGVTFDVHVEIFEF